MTSRDPEQTCWGLAQDDQRADQKRWLTVICSSFCDEIGQRSLIDYRVKHVPHRLIGMLERRFCEPKQQGRLAADLANVLNQFSDHLALGTA